ncbi:MAG: hypothetical protein NVS2B3_12020 [Vulcanimicrobiaceae bacterium]
MPQPGSRTFRLEFTRRHIVFASISLALVFSFLGLTYVRTLRHVEARVGELRSLNAVQRGRLHSIDAATTNLDRELHALRRQNEQIRRLIGERSTAPKTTVALPRIDGRESFAGDRFDEITARIERLRAESHAARNDGDRLRRVALRVLNMRRLEDLARARVLAAIPSLDPTDHLTIASTFGWRMIPWPEFHAGVDLDEDLGANVRAGAAGTVVSAGYEGGYGNKIEIDHGNGYRTWYCHLSRIDVRAGAYVRKAEHIALVGSTGASTGPHLHYQIMRDGHAIDPMPYLHGVPADVLASLR